MVAVLAAALAFTAPAPCTAEQTRATVTAVALAWTRGDIARLETLIAREPLFRWFSVASPGRRVGPVASRRGTLARYFRARHAAGDRVTLVAFRFTGSDVRDSVPYGHFTFHVRRSAADHEAGASFRATGKGAIVCPRARPALAVWSMSGPSPR